MTDLPHAEAYQAWVQAFLAAQDDFGSIGKGSKVDTGTYSYNYAALPDILEQVVPALRDHGLVLLQSVEGSSDEVRVWTRIYHTAGHVETFGPLVLGVRGDAKATGSAITYARRYALTAALGIAPDEDDDAGLASRPAAPQVEVRTGAGTPAEPRELTPWQWVWTESAIFKSWTSDQRLAAAQVALESLALAKEPANREEAEAVLTHMRGQYETTEASGEGYG
jgi:hypothetical protein